MDIDDEELHLLQSQQMLLFSGQVWSRSDDELLLEPDSEDGEERHVLIEDSDEQSQLSLGIEHSPPASSLPGRPDASSAFSQDRARYASDSEHLIESEEDEGDADVEDDREMELLELSDDQEGLVLSDQDELQHDVKAVQITAPSHTSHGVLQEVLDGLETSKLVIPDDATGAERRQLIIQGLQNLALSFLLQLTLSTTLASGVQDSAHNSYVSDPADASDDSNAELGNALPKKQKTIPRPSYKPIKLRFGKRKTSIPTKRQSAVTDDEEDPPNTEAPSGALRSVIFPTSRHASRTIAHTLRVAEIAKDALDADRTVTLRDIYYRDVALFGTQHKVNSVALTLANTLRIRRSDLNIVAASKGLAHGHLKFVAKDGSETDCMSKEGCLIPPKEEIASIVVPSDLRFILIVEKDAVFRPLANSEFSNDPVLGKSVLITGKGYPDMSTRELAHRLGEELSHSVPILCLVDGDPHGVEIFLNYRDGSKAMQGDEGNLTCPRLQWLGVSAEDMREAGVDREYLLPLTERDISKTYRMLDRDLDAELQRELCHMLHSRKKAEIQILGQTSENGNSTTDGLLEYLRRKIVRFL